MKFIVVIDSIDSLNPKKDSSIAMLRAAQTRGLPLFATTINQLYNLDGISYGSLTEIKVSCDDDRWYQPVNASERAFGPGDIIMMRKDPPFDMRYIYATYLLEIAERQGALVANKPQSLRDANEKAFTLQFPQCCPKTLISANMAKLKTFWHEEKNVIFKPLDGMGGRSIFHMDAQGKNITVALELLTEVGSLPIIAQRYIPAINTTGDKRILIIGDAPVPFALARIPQGDDIRGNLAAGAKGNVVPLSKRDYWLCEQIIPTLIAKGLHFVGIDVIGDYITEINVTSPTCINEISSACNIDIAGDLVDYLVGLCR